ncbi:MAG: hypothetical protein DRI75_09965 [Bacteroidetes bacterium]|nr:MAG: hypothetical protein DRI75_09965 [Bacteroidota bacterium]
MYTKTILFIHQSSELYGSDKTLFYLAREVNNNPNFNAIVVIPNNGPLKELLENNNIKVIISPIVKVSRSMFTIKNIFRLPFIIYSATRKLNKALKNTKIDIVHSNTLAVLVGAFYSKQNKIKHIWHVHEIISKPKIVSKLFPMIVNYFSKIVIYNSNATKTSLSDKHKRLASKSVTILNGLNRDEKLTPISEIRRIRNEVFKFEEKNIVLGLVGRINNWKGHHLLLDSFKRLIEEFDNIKLVFIGSAPAGQENLVKELQEKISLYNLQGACKIIPFQKDIWKIWDSINVAVIPSTEPEPFGLVALEAMLASKAVVAANHGGLKEIVENEITGLLFEPSNKEDLIKKIKKLIVDKQISNSLGNRGYERAIKEFSLDKYCSNFFKIYEI